MVRLRIFPGLAQEEVHEMSRPHSSSRKRKASRQKGKPRVPRYSTLTAREKAEYSRAIDLLYDLRHGEGPYTKLVRKHRLDTRKAHRYLGRNLLDGTRGKRMRASKTDSLVRDLMFPRSVGDVREPVRGLPAATKLSNFFQDRDKLLRGKLSAHDFETKWRGVRVDGRELFANAAAILHMANADVLKLENLYASVGSAR
jgi:hypothetical protein